MATRGKEGEAAYPESWPDIRYPVIPQTLISGESLDFDNYLNLYTQIC